MRYIFWEILYTTHVIDSEFSDDMVIGVWFYCGQRTAKNQIVHKYSKKTVNQNKC